MEFQNTVATFDVLDLDLEEPHAAGIKEFWHRLYHTDDSIPLLDHVKTLDLVLGIV
jgi:hypothetical protein